MENLINLVMDEGNISRDEAITVLHKFACRGPCDWYRKSSRKAGLDGLGLTNKQRKIIEEPIDQVMKGMTINGVSAQIRRYICKR